MLVPLSTVGRAKFVTQSLAVSPMVGWLVGCQ